LFRSELNVKEQMYELNQFREQNMSEIYFKDQIGAYEHIRMLVFMKKLSAYLYTSPLGQIL